MLVVRDGDVTVTLSDDLEVLARRALEVAAPTLRAIETRLAADLDAAQAAWPVRSGASRAGLHLETAIVLDSGARVAIRGSVPYTGWVRPAALHGATTAWARYVAAPVRAAHRELTETLGPTIVDHLIRGGSGG